MLPTSQCIPWVVVLIAESVTKVVLIITIIAFVKQRRLQRQSLYLIIHLAIVDLLAGAISAPMVIEHFGANCGLWEYSFRPLKEPLYCLFPTASFFNLAAFSLERIHATLRPFNHRFVKKTCLLCNHYCYLANGYNQGNRYFYCVSQNTNIRRVYIVHPVWNSVVNFSLELNL